MKKTIVIAIIVAAIAAPTITYAASPLFINTTVNEERPNASQGDENKGQDSSMEDKGADGDSSVDGMMDDESQMGDSSQISGKFMGAGDGFHDAEGTALVIPVNEGTQLRLEEFRSTNGPDLYVYLSTDESASEFVDLGRLKGNIGNQNYAIPDGTDLSKYDTVLIWCKSFSVLFGSAKLTEVTST